MIDRYTSETFKKIWSDENRFQKYLEVEIASLKALAEDGVVPKEDVEKIAKKATFDLGRINELEALTKHDVIAFTRAVDENLGEDKKWLH